jgi:hypothetical protein
MGARREEKEGGRKEKGGVRKKRMAGPQLLKKWRENATRRDGRRSERRKGRKGGREGGSKGAMDGRYCFSRIS